MDRSETRGASSEEREFAILVGELRALGKDIAIARAASAKAQAPMGLSAHREPPAPRLSGERTRLPDGAEIVIRPIEANDAPLLQLTLGHLSALSRYRRFREPVDHFSTRELDELTHADHRTREALVALDPVASEERARRPGVGLERFTATTLVGSEDARQLLAHVADPVSEHREGGIVEITARLRSSGAR